jgi:hypothetical protein
MKKMKVLLLVIFAFAGRSNAQTYSYDFTTGNEGWTGDFADYPVSDSVFYQLAFLRTTLPSPLNTGKHALKISGKNHSDDLFMFIKRKITGLLPGTSYQLRIDVQFASIAPTNAVGVGGAPGEGVVMKAGATLREPKKINTNGFYRMNIDKANQSQPGMDMDTIGHVGVSDTTTVFTLIQRDNASHLFNITTDSSGSVWVCIGTDSGFESTTTLYYNQITLAFSNATGLNDVSDAKSELEVYPNPADEWITIKTNPALSDGRYSVRNLFGKVVLQGVLTADITKIGVSNLPPGLYTICVGEKLQYPALFLKVQI